MIGDTSNVIPFPNRPARWKRPTLRIEIVTDEGGALGVWIVSSSGENVICSSGLPLGGCFNWGMLVIPALKRGDEELQEKVARTRGTARFNVSLSAL